MEPKTRPFRNIMFGLTHDAETGAEIIKEPKLVKVGIGMPKGKAILVWMQGGKWRVRVGFKEGQSSTKEFETKSEAQTYYYKQLETAPICPYPRKASFFIFTRKAVQQDGTEIQEPHWEAIEAHGSTPTRISVVFLDDEAFSGGYQMWSSSELRCHGDGVTALRVLSMAATPQEKELAEQAKAAGDKYFPIIDGCWTKGCRFAKEEVKGDKKYPSACKPGLDIRFQLAKSIRVGGTAYFHSGGIRSIQQVFSAVARIKSITGGRIAGIPLEMSISPYRTNHDGQAATQYGVALEFRAEDIASLTKNMLEQALNFRQLPAPPPRQIESGEEPLVSAQEIHGEFYVSDEPSEDDGDQEAVTPKPDVAAAVQQKTTQTTVDMALRVKEKRQASQPAQTLQSAIEAAPMAETPLEQFSQAAALAVQEQAPLMAMPKPVEDTAVPDIKPDEWAAPPPKKRKELF